MSKRLFTHVHKDPWLYNHPKPPRTFGRELADLLKYSTRIEALKSFLTEKNLRTMKRFKGRMISFGDHDMFGQMILDFECTEAQLSEAICSMATDVQSFVLRTAAKLKFVREDIYDSRAWCHLFLSDFVPFTGLILDDPKLKNDYNGHRPPEFMPVIHFGVRNKVWDVDRSCFKVERRQKKYKQVCVMNFVHPQLNQRFNEDGLRRWVGEMEIPEGKKLKDIEPLLMAEVEKECAKHYVKITPCWQTSRLNGEQPLQLGVDHKAKIHVR